MSAHSIPVVATLIRSFGDWLRHRREMNELRQLNTSEFDRIADELRVSPANLTDLVKQGPHAADQLPHMLAALGIDEEALARTQPLVLRDMERVCALCHHKGECVRDFADGSAADHYEEYCPNAPTIETLGPEARK
jgi:transcriptional regulator with XRE-family HTH domain